MDPTDLTVMKALPLPENGYRGRGFMKTTLGFGIIVLLVLSVAFAGCSGTSQPPATPTAASGTPAAAATSQPAAAGTAAPASASADQLFGAAYNWVEYKMTGGSGGEEMTIYMKWTKEGKCTMRFEGAGATQMQGMPTSFDCSSQGGAAQSNPNEPQPDVKLVKVGTEPVTVPAGTFVADKYTATSQGTTATYWFVTGKPLVKMEGSNAEGKAVMELNGWG